MAISARQRVRLRRWQRAYGPAMSRPKPRDLVLAALGAGLALGLAACLVAFLQPDGGRLPHPLALFAPLGATAFLVFAVPASPLAQPWSVVMGTVASAATALLVLALGLPEPVAIALALSGSFLVMAGLRAMHPPGAAMALSIVLLAGHGGIPGPETLLVPILLDALLLVLAAMLWARLSGRHYPFRPPRAPAARRSHRRADLDAADLAAILDRLKLSANIGAGDYARLLDAAGDAAARLRLGGLDCRATMTPDPVTARPETSRPALRALLLRHGIKTLPVVTGDGQLAGLLGQSDLLRHEDNSHTAATLMDPAPVTVDADSPATTLVALLADGRCQSVPVLAGGRLVGIITRSDLIALLARS